ncbi:pyridoxamine 5'-phosphate oxidase family protein [Wolinella succinogenes]|uniref:pyridoxamine 5'-phosphate oxidase family protein n=1 Tax=Wolinella succinogenes TaxID=844 RepID=UPI002409EC45|nr:pyridoxamine 5'-phosphate oxidase family protein [Wolinella succinogenes]
MRRDEFASYDPNLLQEILQRCDYGTLALFDSKPYALPINFASHGEKIVFHGAKAGRKFEILSQRPLVALSVVLPYAFIPSHFSDTSLACPATQFFISAHLSGEVELVCDSDLACVFLESLMQKMQKEGGYEPITPQNTRYTHMLEKTATFALTPKEWSIKVKLGQNRPPEAREKLIAMLLERGEPLDIFTVEALRSLA